MCIITAYNKRKQDNNKNERKSCSFLYCALPFPRVWRTKLRKNNQNCGVIPLKWSSNLVQPRTKVLSKCVIDSFVFYRNKQKNRQKIKGCVGESVFWSALLCVFTKGGVGSSSSVALQAIFTSKSWKNIIFKRESALLLIKRTHFTVLYK